MINLSRILTLAAVLCLLACAKKTQEAVQYSPPSESRNQEDGPLKNRKGGPPQFSQLLAEMDFNR